MPEGPSIVILKEQLQPFKNKVIQKVEGNSRLDIQRMERKRIKDLKSWGKHFLICFSGFTVRIHFMLFGSYTINSRKDTKPRLRLIFQKGEINFYACSIRFLEGDIHDYYDWSADIMNEKWNPRAARKKLLLQPETAVCDAILDQHIFSGAGNIFKNEVLFKTRIHPMSKTGSLPSAKLSSLIKEVHNYSFDFLKWKKAYVLRKHWKAHTKKICPRCHIPFQKEYCGKTHRRSFFCNRCQRLYD